MAAQSDFESLAHEVDEALRGDAALSARQIDDVQQLRAEAQRLHDAGQDEDAERVLQQAIITIKTRVPGSE